MLLSYILIFGFVVFDQVIKLLSIAFSNESTSLIKTIIPNVLEFHYTVNTGASFGMFKDAQMFFSLVTIISLVIFGFLFYESNIKTKKVYTLGIIFLIAGTFGNAIDRLFRGGGVVDMINMPIINSIMEFFGLSGFIFNFADLYMTLGIILFIVDILFLERKRVEKNEENPIK